MDSLNELAIPSRIISPGIHLRLIRNSDLSALSRFEIDNRTWFERHIASRGNYFYLPEGIRGHITHCLDEFAANRMQPMVLVDDAGEIIGRCNLHQIDLEEAKLGYRLAAKHAGRGLAFLAARLLVEDAKNFWNLPQVRSYVIADNYASVRTLEKLGFAYQGKANKVTHLLSGDVYSDDYLLRL